jgi:hypothetical protein
MRTRHTRWSTAVAVSVALGLAGCTGGDDDLPEGLTEIGDTQPPDDGPDESDDPDEQAEPEEADESDDPDVDDPESDEPDESDEDGITISGVFVPDSAFEINHDIDLDEEDQLHYLQFTHQA